MFFHPRLQEIVFYLYTLTFQGILFLHETGRHLSCLRISDILKKSVIPRIYPSVFIHPPVYIISGICILNPVDQGGIILGSAQTVTEGQIHTQVTERKHGIDISPEFRIGHPTSHFVAGIPNKSDVTESVDE